LSSPTPPRAPHHAQLISCLLGAAVGLGWFVILFTALAYLAYLALISTTEFPDVGLFIVECLFVALATFWILPLLGLLAGRHWPVRRSPAAVRLIPPGTKPVVIPVHGTFAHRAEDQGDAWWQQGGALSTRLEHLAPRQYDCWPLHWDGQNLESARHAAANCLCGQMQALEANRRPYHLVGHSHGGSVVWQALVESVRRGQRMDHLQSWTTIGTPFFQVRTQAPSLWQAVPLLVIAVLGLDGAHALLPMWTQTNELWPVFVAFKEGNVAPLMVLDALIGGLGALGALLLIDLVWRLAGVVRNRSAQRLEAAAYEQLKGRHLALASAADEAIQGLAAARRLSASEVQLVPPLPYLTSSAVGRLFSPLTFPVVGLWNAICASPINVWVFELVRRKIHGNDRWGTTVTAVSSLPAADTVSGSLPAEEDEALDQATGEAAGPTLRRMREALGIFASGSPISVLRSRDPISQNALVHNSYFGSEAIVDRICRNVLAPARGPAAAAAVSSPSPTPRAAGPFFYRTHILPAIMPCLVLVGLYTVSRAVYEASVEPLTTSARLNDLVAATDRVAHLARGKDLRVWLGALCATGRCGPIRYEYLAESGDDDRLETALELARWRAACGDPACKAQQQGLLSELGQVVASLSPGYYQADEPATYEHRSRNLWQIASRLAGIRQVPDALALYPIEDLTGATTPGFPALMAGIENLSAEVSASPRLPAQIRARLLYLTPLLHVSASAVKMRAWDQGVPVADRLENKLALAEAAACHLDVKDGFEAELPVERISRLSRASSLWWGECRRHLEVARTALAAAAEDHRALPLRGLPRTRLLLRLWLAVAQIQNDTRYLHEEGGPEAAGDTTIPDLGSAAQREVEGTLLTDAADDAILPLLEAIAGQSSAELSAATEAGLEQAFLSRLRQDPEALPELMRGCLALRHCKDLKAALLRALANMPETPVAWDDALASFSQIVYGDEPNAAANFSYKSLPLQRLHTLDLALRMRSAAQATAGLLLDAARHGKLAEIHPEEAQTQQEPGVIWHAEIALWGMHAGEGALAAELLHGTLDAKTASQVYFQAARGLAAAGYFHQALRYLDSIPLYEERLLAASETLMRYERLKRALPHGDADTIADWGNRNWDRVRRAWLAQNPSH
jgi:hypothetical protein